MIGVKKDITGVINDMIGILSTISRSVEKKYWISVLDKSMG
jgi:hypothetical protein